MVRVAELLESGSVVRGVQALASAECILGLDSEVPLELAVLESGQAVLALLLVIESVALLAHIQYI